MAAALNKGEHSNALTRQKLGVSASDDKAATVTYGRYCGFRSSGVPFTSAHRQNCYKTAIQISESFVSATTLTGFEPVLPPWKGGRSG
jgi:hypothetical protein